MVKSEEIRDRQKLANLITQWNLDHYDLFELSAPNEVNKELLVFCRLCRFLIYVYMNRHGTLRSISNTCIQVNSGDSFVNNFQNGRQLRSSTQTKATVLTTEGLLFVFHHPENVLLFLARPRSSVYFIKLQKFENTSI